MPFNFSSPEYLSPHKRRKNWVSPVSRASPAYMNSPLVVVAQDVFTIITVLRSNICDFWPRCFEVVRSVASLTETLFFYQMKTYSRWQAIPAFASAEMVILPCWQKQVRFKMSFYMCQNKIANFCLLMAAITICYVCSCPNMVLQSWSVHCRSCGRALLSLIENWHQNNDVRDLKFMVSMAAIKFDNRNVMQLMS